MCRSAGRFVAFDQAEKSVAAQTRGNYPAPIAILSCIRTGLEKGMSAGFAAEQREFGRLARTPESQALMSIFFATQSLKKNRFGNPKTEG